MCFYKVKFCPPSFFDTFLCPPSFLSLFFCPLHKKYGHPWCRWTFENIYSHFQKALNVLRSQPKTFMTCCKSSSWYLITATRHKIKYGFWVVKLSEFLPLSQSNHFPLCFGHILSSCKLIIKLSCFRNEKENLCVT